MPRKKCPNAQKSLYKESSMRIHDFDKMIYCTEERLVTIGCLKEFYRM